MVPRRRAGLSFKANGHWLNPGLKYVNPESSCFEQRSRQRTRANATPGRKANRAKSSRRSRRRCNFAAGAPGSTGWTSLPGQMEKSLVGTNSSRKKSGEVNGQRVSHGCPDVRNADNHLSTGNGAMVLAIGSTPRPPPHDEVPEVKTQRATTRRNAGSPRSARQIARSNNPSSMNQVCFDLQSPGVLTLKARYFPSTRTARTRSLRPLFLPNGGPFFG
jgi:hypothetical protein